MTKSNRDGSDGNVIRFIQKIGDAFATGEAGDAYEIINSIIGEDVAPVGNGLSTCTQQIEAYRYEVPPDSEGNGGRTVFLIDTPGFDHTAIHDSTKVLKGVAQYAAQNTSPPRTTAFVYLQDISKKCINNRRSIDFSRLQRFLGEWPPRPPSAEPPRFSISTDNRFAGRGASDSASKSVIYQEAEDRENELENKVWKDLLDKGAEMLRVEDGSVPARAMVQEVLNGLRFINLLCGHNGLMEVSHGLRSCTEEIGVATLMLPPTHPLFPNRRLVLVDTPGFNDTHKGESEILRKISVWLGSVYDKSDMQAKVTGLVYLHNISQNRMGKMSRLSHDLFGKICGSAALETVVMASTHWDVLLHCNPGAAPLREGELKEFWAESLSRGAVYKTIGAKDPRRDIEGIIDLILEKHAVVTRVQEELVEQGKRVAETDASRTLRETLESWLPNEQ
ncbi:hypothetical protein MD484_g3523, partial [Candolleomyces efflorescens]